MFFSGVIEGFYGRAWTGPQRVEMLDWIRSAGMNTFVYAPKDDIKLRARWRETYDAAEAAKLRELVDAASERGLTFMVAIAPCLDITYSDAFEVETLKRRIDQLLQLGVHHIALLFDDIPNRLSEVDAAVFPSFAAAQCHVANAAFAHLKAQVPDGKMLFCPTEYCAAFTGHKVKDSAYLNVLGAELDPEIGVFWTGPDIVSETITAASLEEVGSVLRRRPVIWENFHANDYDIRRVYAGPLGGRGSDILEWIDGIITNPNNEFEADFVPVRTTGAFARGAYDETSAWSEALEAWRERFTLAYTSPIDTLTIEEIRLLTELFHQPFKCGPEIEALLDMARDMLSVARPDVDSPHWQAGFHRLVELRDRIRALFERMTELENRDLFYAFHPYLWEAREEVVHLCTYLGWLREKPAPDAVFPDRERIYNFYRRGFTVAVQELLPRNRDGRYRHVA